MRRRGRRGRRRGSRGRGVCRRGGGGRGGRGGGGGGWGGGEGGDCGGGGDGVVHGRGEREEALAEGRVPGVAKLFRGELAGDRGRDGDLRAGRAGERGDRGVRLERRGAEVEVDGGRS